MAVQRTSNVEAKRHWDKLHFCLFCGSSSTNILKHYIGPHKNEDEVQKVLALAKGSKERQLEIMRLRNAGDYQHNMGVLRSGDGTLATCTRRNDATVNDYLPCEDCLGFFLKDILWRHRKTCPFNTKGIQFMKVQSQAKLLLPSSLDISEGLKEKVIKRMANDNITICARNDSIIIKIGENMLQKHGHHSHMMTFISQKMRELARFLIVARKEDQQIICLSDVIDPSKFKVAIKSTRVLCGYNEQSNQFLNPSLALKIGQQLKKCARVKKSEALMTHLPSKGELADNFLTLCENEWTHSISSCALQTITNNKMNKGQMLPLADDIKKFQNFLEETADKCLSCLGTAFQKCDWELLNKVTLTRLVLFNRKRGWEVERMNVSDYISRQVKNTSLKEIDSALSPVERMLCSRLCRVEIREKKGRTVPVLLLPVIRKSIDLLLKFRKEAGVHENNIFLFARPNYESLNSIRLSDTLRSFRSNLDLTAEELLTSTRLRKHVATVSQILNLSKKDMEVLADFMGHDIEVHMSFYRLPQDTIQVAKMGKLLTAFNNGTISKYSGKSLDEISLDEELSSDEEAEDDQTMESNSASNNQILELQTEDGWTGPSSASVSVRKTCKGQKQARKIQRLTEEQNHLLRKLFGVNVTMRREMKMIDCMNAIKQHKCLSSLDWLKIKNTVHNWITADKRKLKQL